MINLFTIKQFYCQEIILLTINGKVANMDLYSVKVEKMNPESLFLRCLGRQRLMVK